MGDDDTLGFVGCSAAADCSSPCGAPHGNPCHRILDAVGVMRRDGDAARLRMCLGPRMRGLGVASFAEYADLIVADSDTSRREREWLTGEFSTGETYFLRDLGLFQLLGARIVPELLAKATAGDSLRILSAGCSSGEEAYSLAILVDELAPAIGGRDVRIIGTDINSGAIARAQAGIYGQWSFRGLDAARVERYFKPCRGGRQVVDSLRAMVDFEHHDLLRDDLPAPGAFDLILCRNVFIYLSSPSVKHIVAKLAAGLTPGGCLIAGHGELLGVEPPGLEPLACPEALLYCRPPVGRQCVQEAAAVVPAHPRRVAPRAPRATCAKPQRAAGDARELLAQAWREADRGRVATARDLCERLLRLAPFEPQLYYLLAQIAHERGVIDEARQLLHKVLYLDPRFIAAYLELADLCAHQGDLEGARRMRECACRELARMPADAELSAPAGTTAGTLLQGLLGRMANGTSSND